ncbi:MAG: bifunctional metallophosphatase/5'-nucleotidase, partial [bacterium]
ADLIASTSGIDVVLDGHSHDTDQVVMKNRDGEEVPRSAVGTKLSCIGYSYISREGEIVETGIWSWPNAESAPLLLNIQNEMRSSTDQALQEIAEILDTVVAETEVELTINDPEAADASGRPVRMIRRAETNLGDLCADAFRDQSGADIALVNGGAVRISIEKGPVTYRELISVYPFGNMLCVAEVKGQQILDALEWGARSVPWETGAFLQVSGLAYEINTLVDSPCQSEGQRRVQNVMVGEDVLDPEKTYTVAGSNYLLMENGDGNTSFSGSTLLQDNVKLDNQVLIDYIVDSLGGVIGGEYSDPWGQGRITILE